MGQIPADRRITTRREIVSMLRGDRVSGPSLELFWKPASQQRSRAMCITPKHGHTSVERNRLRRRLKEAMRATLLTRSIPMDYLVRARPPAYELDFGGLKANLEDLESRAGLAT